MTSYFSKFLSGGLGVLLLMSLPLSVEAASITLVPTTPTTGLAPGDTVSFDIVMDFTTDDNGLGSDITLGGGFDIVFDPTALQLQVFTNAMLGDPQFGRDPDILSGLLESWGFADFNGLTGPELVGTVSFTVSANAPAMSSVSTSATSGIAGPFVSGVDFITILNVDFNSVVLVVPEPRTMLGSMAVLGALAMFGRRRRAA